MNKFLKSDSLDVALNNMCKKDKEGTDNRLNYDLELQLKKKFKNDKVDFNLNNIEDQTDDKNDSKKDKINVDIDSIKKTKNLNQNNSRNDVHQSSNQQKAIDIEKLKQSTKQKSKRILKCLERTKKKFNCTDDEAIDLMIKNRKINRPENVKKQLSLEDHFEIESNLHNKLKVSFRI